MFNPFYNRFDLNMCYLRQTVGEIMSKKWIKIKIKNSFRMCIQVIYWNKIFCKLCYALLLLLFCRFVVVGYKWFNNYHSTSVGSSKFIYSFIYFNNLSCQTKERVRKYFKINTFSKLYCKPFSCKHYYKMSHYYKLTILNKWMISYLLLLNVWAVGIGSTAMC